MLSFTMMNDVKVKGAKKCSIALSFLSVRWADLKLLCILIKPP